MKILCFSDVHWSKTSSIITQMGVEFPLRLEFLLKSLNWVNKIALEQNCDLMLCAGDFMDKPFLDDIEVTALKKIEWNNLPCYFIIGNHESSVNSLKYSSVKALECSNHIIVDAPQTLTFPGINICCIPYIAEDIKKPLIEYLPPEKAALNIIVMHNDIAGINYAGFVSKAGFSADELSKNCDICLNGHLHNSEFVRPNVLNLGSLSAHNFSNDSFKYSYGVWIIDTDTRNLQFIENPFTLRFYKFDILEKTDFKILTKLKENSVVSIRCKQRDFKSLKTKLLANSNILANRIFDLVSSEGTITGINLEENFSLDHFKKFEEICKASFEQTPIFLEELSKICS